MSVCSLTHSLSSSYFPLFLYLIPPHFCLSLLLSCPFNFHLSSFCFFSPYSLPFFSSCLPSLLISPVIFSSFINLFYQLNPSCSRQLYRFMQPKRPKLTVPSKKPLKDLRLSLGTNRFCTRA